jgi:putative acetyltransferase
VSGHLIRPATTVEDLQAARELFAQYQRELGVDLCFQGFEEELATLPGAYAPPRGRLLLAGDPEALQGCVALRPLVDDTARADIAEMKRLYVCPQARGTGLGRALAEAIIAQARLLGYHELKLDTLAQMKAARALYVELGFRECEPYYHNPLDGTLYMSCTL